LLVFVGDHFLQRHVNDWLLVFESILLSARAAFFLKKKKKKTYQKVVHTLGNLPLRSSDGDFIAGLLGAGKHDLAVPLLLEGFDIGEASQQVTVVQTIHVDNLGRELGVLSNKNQYTNSVQWKLSIRASTYHAIHHLENLALHKLEILSVPSRGSADHIVHPAVIVFSAHPS
jgi:hypothetical protein